MKLENIIESAAENLPDGWEIIINVENGWAGVTAKRPDGSVVSMDDGETDITEQAFAALKLSQDETSTLKVTP